VTACDLEKSFIFEKTVEITSHLLFRCICKRTDIIGSACDISSGVGVKKVSNSKGDVQGHSRLLVMVSQSIYLPGLSFLTTRVATV